MALREAYMKKVHLGAGNLEIIAKPDESILIKNILVENPATDYAIAKVEQTTVGVFRCGGGLGSHISFPRNPSQHTHDLKTSGSALADQTSFAGVENAGGVEIASKMIGGLAINTRYKGIVQKQAYQNTPPATLIKYLEKLGIWKGIPVAPGQKFLLEKAGGNGAIQAVEYEIYDPEDISATMPNGTDGTEYLFFNYGTVSADIASAGDFKYTVSNSPNEFPNFPFDAVVPANYEIDLMGIAASNYSPGTSTPANYTRTKYLRLMHERKCLFDPDRRGILHQGGVDVGVGNLPNIGVGSGCIGNYSSADGTPPFIPPTPITFTAGAELNIYLTTEATGTPTTIIKGATEICLILNVRRTK